MVEKSSRITRTIDGILLILWSRRAHVSLPYSTCKTKGIRLLCSSKNKGCDL